MAKRAHPARIVVVIVDGVATHRRHLLANRDAVSLTKNATLKKNYKRLPSVDLGPVKMLLGGERQGSLMWAVVY